MEGNFPVGTPSPVDARRQIESLRAELEELRERERRFRVTLNSIGDAVITTDAEGKITLLNPVAEDLSGWGREAIGQPVEKVFRIINTQTRKPVDSPVACVLEEGKVVGLAHHTSLISKDGREYQIADSGAPIVDDNREVIGAVLVFHDISDQYASEEAIRRNERFLDTLVENSPHPLWVSDAEGNVIRVNAAVSKALNLTAEQMVGTYNPLRDENLQREGLMPLVHRVFREKVGVRFDLMWDPVVFDEEKFRGGRRRHADVSMYPITDDENNLLNVVCQWTDTTEARENSMALRESETNLRLAQELAGIGSWSWHVPSDSIRWSDRAFRLWGHEPGGFEVTFENTRRQIHPDDREMCDEMLKQTLEKGSPHRFETRIILPDGRVRWLAVYGNILMDSQGAPELLAGVFRDVTDEHRKTLELRMIYEATENAYSAFDIVGEDGKIIYVNKAYARMWGYESPEEIVGTSPASHCVDPMMPERIIGQLKSEGIFEQEFEARRKDGSHFTVLMNGGISRDESGKEVYFSSSIDVTERRMDRERIEHLNSVLSSIREINQLIARSPSALRLVREVTEILVRNRGFDHVWCALIGEDGRVTDFSKLSSDFPTAEERSMPEVGLMPPCLKPLREGTGILFIDSSGESCSEKTDSSSAGDSTFGFCGLLRFSGRDFGVLSITSAKGSTIGEDEKSLFAEICTDLGFALSNIEGQAEKERVFEEMAKAKAEAELANRAKDEFLAVMSHELRTPLNPILGFTQLLRENSRGEDARMLDTINAAGRRQLKLIEQILDYTRLDRSEVVAAAEPYFLLELCETAFEDLRPNDSRLSYRFFNGSENLDRIPEGLEVIGDPDMLIRILENLLQNACKYTKKGSISFTVGLANASGEDGVECSFAVRDTGIGMDTALKDKIFQAFTQGDSSYSRVQGGVGLGLAICSKLVDVLGGRIELESALGRGSCFTVCVPLRVSPTRSEGGGAIKFAEMRRLSQALSVLVVEDDEGNREYIQRLLEGFGARVEVVSSGEDGARLCGKVRFDVVLMDIHMPVLNGFETTRKIRCDGLNQDTPIFALTADLAESVRKQCVCAGMEEFVPKPVSPSDLFRKLERYVKS